MPIRYRLLLLLPLLVTLGIGSFGAFSINIIRSTLKEAEVQRLVGFNDIARRQLNDRGGGLRAAASVLAAQIVAEGLPEPGVWPAGNEPDEGLDFAFILNPDGGARATWVRGFEEPPAGHLEGWGLALSSALDMGESNWLYRNLEGEPVLYGFAPVEVAPGAEGGAGARAVVILGMRLGGEWLVELTSFIQADFVLLGATSPEPVEQPRRGDVAALFTEPQVAGWIATDVLSRQISTTLEQGTFVLMGQPLWRMGELAGGYVIVSDIGGLQRHVQSLIDYLTLSLTLWVVISAISAVLVGSSIANPIDQLATAVRDMQSGREADFPMERRDELGFLARQLFDMNAEIEKRFAEVEELHGQTREALEARSRFLSSMSHELRTPLNGIIGMGEVLGEPYWGELSEDQAGFVGNILDSAKHLLQLINDILDVSRAEAGKIVPAPELVQAEGVLQAVVDEQRVLAERAQVTVKIECEEGTRLWCDPRHARQILTNLLSNAIKYNRPGGSVLVRAVVGLEGGHTLIEVSDTGVGIPEEDLDSVFEAFSRRREADLSSTSGTGLGLALVRQLTELNQGHVILRSSTEEGTTFHLVFFALPPPPSAQLPAAGEEEA